jgi:UDP-N-acetylglucosamine transferase subunit ALG13
MEHMARPKKTEGNLDAIAAERARLKAELSKLDALEKQARQAVSDAGRGTLLAALERVKIGSMSKAAAKVIAVVIAAEGGDEVAKKLGE